jgi:hypothetical protein
VEYIMTFQSTRFNMGDVMNKLRAIAENGPDTVMERDPGMEVGGKEIDDASFTRTMSRLTSIKDAVSPEHFEAVKGGIRAMYMNHRPNLQQMSALMDLLETLLAYVSEDNSLFQRLKGDLAHDKPKAQPEPGQSQDQEVGAPSTAIPAPDEEQAGAAVQQAGMRGLK